MPRITSFGRIDWEKFPVYQDCGIGQFNWTDFSLKFVPDQRLLTPQDDRCDEYSAWDAEGKPEGCFIGLPENFDTEVRENELVAILPAIRYVTMKLATNLGASACCHWRREFPWRITISVSEWPNQIFNATPFINSLARKMSKWAKEYNNQRP